MPDAVETLKAAKILLKEGFIVLPYIQTDSILAKHLDIEVATVMLLGSPIGSNGGIRTRDAIEIIIEGANILMVVDAGPMLTANNIKTLIQPSRLAQNPFCAGP